MKNKLELYFEVKGSGLPVLFLHGYCAHSFTWRLLIPGLANISRTITLDLLGFGRSPKPFGASYSFDEHVQMIADVMVSNRWNPVVIVGHSMGGLLALRLTRFLRDSGSADVRGVVVIDGAVYPEFIPLSRGVFNVIGKEHLKMAVMSREAQTEWVLRQCYCNPGIIDPAAVKAYSEPLRSLAAQYAMAQTFRRLKAFSRMEDVSWRDIDIPALILWGKEDRIISVHAGEKLHEEIPRSRLSIFESCGHVPQEEKPGETLRELKAFILRFCENSVQARQG